MDNILKNLKEINIFIEDLILLREGETSNTFTGLLSRKKIILKIFKKFNTNFKTNSYLNRYTLTELSNKKLHPKVIYKNKTKGILIYEYYETSLCKKDNMFFKILGNRLKELHELCGGNREIEISRELTKKFEEHIGTNLDEVINYFEREKVLGEITIVIKGIDENNIKREINTGNIKSELHELVSLGLTLSAASKYLAKRENLTKNFVYKLY